MFEVEAQEPLPVKGVDEPIQSYLVLRAKPRSFRIGTRGIEGVATRMIGRDAELEALQDAFKRLFAERRLAAVTVVADAGIGKSRLLYEFEAWSEARPEAFFIFRGRATPQTQGQPFGLLRDILAWRFQIADDDSVEVARAQDGARHRAALRPRRRRRSRRRPRPPARPPDRHRLARQPPHPRHPRRPQADPEPRAPRGGAAVPQGSPRRDGTPVVLQLEDLHWADNESLDFLDYLAEVNRDVPLLMLAFTRPTLFERRVDWQGAGAEHRASTSRRWTRRTAARSPTSC